MSTYIKTIFFIFSLIIFTASIVFPITFCLIFFKKNRYDRAIYIIQKFWANCLLKTAGVSIELINQTTLPLKTPVIIISNHQSHFDIPALFSVLPIKISILTKMELFKIPIFGWLMKKAGHISVDRFNSQKSKEALLKAENMLNDVEGILIFAEGTRSSDGNIQKFKKGGFFLAANTCAPILPVVIKGSIDIHKKGGKKLHSGKIKITFLDCFHVEFRDPDKIRFLCHELHDKMTEIYRSL